MKTWLAALLIAGMGLVGCESKQPTERVDFGPQITEVANAAEAIQLLSKDTVASADEWQKVAPSDKHHTEIVQLQTQVQKLTAQQRELTVELAEARDQIKTERADSDAIIKKLEAELEESYGWAKKLEQGIYISMIALGMLAILGGIGVATISKTAWWLLISAGGIVSVAIGKFMLSAGWVIPALGGVGLVVLAAFAGFMIWERRDAVRAKAKMLRAVLDEADPTTPREAVAMLRASDRALDKAMSKPDS